MTLITAMLVLIYKRENEMGYTIGKFSFFMEMQDWVVKLMATRIRKHETKGKNTIMAIFVTVIRYIQKNLSTTYDL